MIPRNGPKSEQLPSLKLYREDVDKLIAVFVKNCQFVRIGDEEHVYDSLDDMATHAPPRLSSLLISGVGPQAELVLRGSYKAPLGVQRSTLWIAERNEKSELVFLSAKELLYKHKWNWSIIFRVALLCVGIVLLAVSIFGKSLPSHSVVGLRSDLLALFAFGLLVGGGVMHGKQVSYLTLAPRVKSESFLRRNWEKIAMAFIGAVVGIGAKSFVDWLIHFFR